MSFDWKKAIILFCMFMFLADLAEDGRTGPAKSRIGWGHGVSTHTESFSHDIRPLPQKTKVMSRFSADSLFAAPLPIILRPATSLISKRNPSLKAMALAAFLSDLSPVFLVKKTDNLSLSEKGLT